MEAVISLKDLPKSALSWIGQYIVSVLPRDHKLMEPFAVRVTNIGLGDWVVTTNYGHDIWRTGPVMDSYRIKTDDPVWRKDHVFSLPKAHRLAWDVATIHTVNKRTALEVLAERGDCNDEPVLDDREAVGTVQAGDAPADVPAGDAGEPYNGRHRRY